MSVDRVRLDKLTTELGAQRRARDGLRTRAVAVLSAGAIVLSFAQAQGGTTHLDVWLVAALATLVVIGLCVFRILAPAPALILDHVLDPAAIPATSTATEEESDSQFYGEVTRTIIDGIRADRRWTNRMSVFFFVSALSLVVEITLIAIHFQSGTSYRAAIGLIALLLLILFATTPLREILATFRSQEGTILPYRIWRFFLRIPIVRGWMSGAVLDALEVAPLRVAGPPPDVRFERPSGAETLEEAISHKDGVLEAFRKSQIYALGEPSGDVSPGVSGTESDLLHFTADVAGRETVFLPVFTDPELMRLPLEKNPEWQTLSILEIDGGALLDAADADVTIVVNPWSEKEFEIPPDQRPDGLGRTAGHRKLSSRRNAAGATRTAVLAALAGGEARTARDISAATNLQLGSVRAALYRLTKAGEVVKVDGGYRVS